MDGREHVIDLGSPLPDRAAVLRYAQLPAGREAPRDFPLGECLGAISGSVKQPHSIDPSKCIKCGVCMDTCKFGAISKK